MDKKQTAVEYFFNKMIEYLHNAESEGIYEVGTQNTKKWLDIFLDEAKAMEEEKIVNAYANGQSDTLLMINQKINKMKDIPTEFNEIINKNFWDLI